MARAGLVTPLLVLAAVCGLVCHQVGFIGAQKSPAQRAKTARQAAAPTPPPASSTSDFTLPSIDVLPVDGEMSGRASGIVFFYLGFAWVPVLKGITCALVFGALAYFAGNGQLTGFIGKSEGAKDYAGTAKSLEDLSAGLGGYCVKAYNFAAEKVKGATAKA